MKKNFFNLKKKNLKAKYYYYPLTEGKNQDTEKTAIHA